MIKTENMPPRLIGPLKHLQSADQLHSLADARELSGSKAILELCEKKLETERRAHEKNLKTNPEFIRDHPYFQLGVIDALKWVLGLPELAQVEKNKYR